MSAPQSSRFYSPDCFQTTAPADRHRAETENHGRILLSWWRPDHSDIRQRKIVEMRFKPEPSRLACELRQLRTRHQRENDKSATQHLTWKKSHVKKKNTPPGCDSYLAACLRELSLHPSIPTMKTCHRVSCVLLCTLRFRASLVRSISFFFFLFFYFWPVDVISCICITQCMANSAPKHL